MDRDPIYFLNVVSGVCILVLIAALIGLYLLRRRRSLFPFDQASGVRVSDIYQSNEERLIHFAFWFVHMRWIACLIASILVVVSIKFLGILDGELFIPLAVSVGFLAVANVAFSLLLHFRRMIQRLMIIQAYMDLVILTVLLHFSGGIENPLCYLMLFHVIISGILLNRRQCYLVAGVGCFLFSVLALMEWGHLVEHYTLHLFPHGGNNELHVAHHGVYVATQIAMQCVILFLTAFFITTIMSRLRLEEQHAASMTARALSDRQKFERVVEATGAGLLVLNKDLEAVWINDRLRAWLHLPQDMDADAATRLRSWIGGEDGPAANTLNDCEMRLSERTLPGTAQDGQCFQITTSPLCGEDGRVSQIVEFVQDITEQKKMQAHLLQVGKMAAIGRLAGNLAHEVNNPVAIIGAKARLLLSDHAHEISEKVVTDLHKIVDLANRLSRITQGLLNYYRPTANIRLATDIRISLRKAVALVEDSAKTAGIQIIENLSTPLPCVRINTDEMEQVFLNLLVNAIDAMPISGVLTVSALADEKTDGALGKFVSVVIQDTGTGIQQEMVDKIFEPFFTTKKEGRGTGLGLSICVGLIDNNQGWLGVDSVPGQGTRFTIRLPVDEKRESHVKDAIAHCR